MSAPPVPPDPPSPAGGPLPRSFYSTDARSLARALLGRTLVRVLESGGVMAGRIVETEAYLGVEDRAAHSFGGRRTARNEVMYAAPGAAYVYFTYGMHFCMNVVCGRRDEPVAVLLRALEPTVNPELFRANRLSPRRRSEIPDTELASGPARLCQAMRIDRSLNGLDLVEDGRMFIARGAAVDDGDVAVCPRIGISGAGEPWASEPLRWVVRSSPHVSVAAPAHAGSAASPRARCRSTAGKE